MKKQEQIGRKAPWAAEPPPYERRMENGLSNLLSIWSTALGAVLKQDTSAGYRCSSIKNSP